MGFSSIPHQSEVLFEKRKKYFSNFKLSFTAKAHLASLRRIKMSKLRFVLCLFVFTVAVLAKPSKLREAQLPNCCDDCSCQEWQECGVHCYPPNCVGGCNHPPSINVGKIRRKLAKLRESHSLKEANLSSGSSDTKISADKEDPM